MIRRVARRYTGQYSIVVDGKHLKPGQFISKATFDKLPSGDTMEHLFEYEPDPVRYVPSRY